MEFEITKRAIEEIEEKIIPTFVEHYANKVTDIGALAVCLQAILNEVDRLKEEMKNPELD